MRLANIKFGIQRRLARFAKALGLGSFMPGPGERAPVYVVDPNYDYVNMEHSYLINPWIHAAVNVRAIKLAELPLKLYQEVGKGVDVERQEVFDHPLVELFYRPNREQSQFEFIRDAGAEISLSGETFIFAENGSRGQSPVGTIKSLHLLHPRFVKRVISPMLGMVSGYEYDQGGHPQIFIPEFVTHAKTYNPESDLRGLSPLEAAKLPYLMKYYMDRYNLAFFKNGGSPKMALTSKGRVADDAKKRNTEEFAKNFLGFQNNGKIPHFDSETTLQMLAVSAKDGEFLGLGSMSREESLAVMQTPPVMVGILADASYANAREQTRAFYELAISPMATLIASAINRRIVDVWYPGKGLYCQFDLSGIEALQADKLRVAQIDHIYLSDGKVTINELRLRDDEDPVAWGDKPYNSLAAAFGGAGGQTQDQPPKSRPIRGKIKALRSTEDGRADLWRTMIGDVAGEEDRFDLMMRAFLGEQKDRVAAAMKEHYAAALAIGYEALAGITPADLGSIFNNDDEDAALRSVVGPMYKTIVQNGGQIGLDAVKDGGTFNVADPRVADLIGQKVGLIARVNTSTREYLANLLTNSALSNQTVDETARAISQMFEEFTPARARMIARTETISAHNGAALEGFRQSGAVQKKEWLSSRDADVRDSHVAVDGIQVDMGALFPNGVDYPGGNGPADETINCRCTVLPVLEA